MLRRLPDLDIVRVQDVGRSGTDDPGVLAWAADTGRIIITHDVTTPSRHAWERVSAGQPVIARLATFDASVPVSAIKGAEKKHVVTL